MKVEKKWNNRNAFSCHFYAVKRLSQAALLLLPAFYLSPPLLAQNSYSSTLKSLVSAR